MSRMVHDRPEEERNEQITLYALGLLEGEDAAEWNAHIEECPVCAKELRDLRESAALVALAAPSVQPPPQLRDQVLQSAGTQVWKRWAEGGAAGLHVVREGEGDWQKVRDGVYAKQLYVDRTRDLVTMLVRMEPGSRYVPHRHAAPEQCFVLQGDIRDGDVVCRAGDFQVLESGSVHGAQWTENGCVVLIVSSLEDELLV